MRTSVLPAAALAACLALPAASLTPTPAPPPPTREAVEKYIACYPKVEFVREKYRAEAKRLEARHDAVLGRALKDSVEKKTDVHAYMNTRASLVERPAAEAVFGPVVRACGFDSVSAYGETSRAIATAWRENSPVVAPYRPKLEGMLLPNMN